MKYADKDHTTIDNGQGGFIPVASENADYVALIQSGEKVAPFTPATATADDVRAEASRRMQALVGARDAAHLAVVIANANREAIRLQNARISYLAGEPDAKDWTPVQEIRAAQLVQIDAMLEAIRQASNQIEAKPPHDYSDDDYWPKFG